MNPSRNEQQILIFFFFFFSTCKQVKNGGTLTHTDDDFRRANYFFCDGMDDPWLNEYVCLGTNLVFRIKSLTLYLDYYLDV